MNLLKEIVSFIIFADLRYVLLASIFAGITAFMVMSALSYIFTE